MLSFPVSAPSTSQPQLSLPAGLHPGPGHTWVCSVSAGLCCCGFCFQRACDKTGAWWVCCKQPDGCLAEWPRAELAFRFLRAHGNTGGAWIRLSRLHRPKLAHHSSSSSCRRWTAWALVASCSHCAVHPRAFLSFSLLICEMGRRWQPCFRVIVRMLRPMGCQEYARSSSRPERLSERLCRLLPLAVLVWFRQLALVGPHCNSSPCRSEVPCVSASGRASLGCQVPG